MDRRALLCGGVSLVVGALAGCLGRGGEGSGGEGSGGENGTDGDAPPNSPDPSATPGQSPTPDSSPTATPTPTDATDRSTIRDRSFAVRDVSCGADRDAAAASADGADVTVTGTIPGSDTCHTARLADVTYRGRDRRLRIGLESYVPESTETPVCGQCIVEIDYEATFTFEGDRPETVVVVHDGRTVASISLSG